MGARGALTNLSGHQRIGGRLVRSSGGASIDVTDPATEQRIGQIADASPTDIDQAVASANAAQHGWRNVNHHRRAELLHEVARRVMADRPLVAEMLTREMGKPYKESFDEVAWSASAIDYYAEIARHENGKVLGSAVDGQFHFTTKDPLGVVVIILPFNYPLCLLCWQAAAAIASGNAVIIKPSDLTSLTTLQFAAAFDYEEFMERLVHYTSQIRVGNGLERVDMGPLASKRELTRYLRILDQATTQGAKVLVGGDRPAHLARGWFVNPTVLGDISPDAPIMNDETFGPVAPVSRVASFDEAVTLANRSRYALGATVYTTNLEESMRAVNELEAGMVWVNAPLLDNDAGPFGGRKQSGMGRQLGAEGLDTFRHTKLSMIDYGARAHDFWWFPYSDAEAFPGSRND
jgi:acyl-CoA reductase-like NAD-dependent aldehyde dehydrogenase